MSIRHPRGVEFLADQSQCVEPGCPQDARRTSAASGDDGFVARHQGSLWRYLRYLGCPDDLCEDFLHDAFLAALEHGIASRPPGVARAWMRTTLRNLVFAELRRSARRPVRVAMDLARLDSRWRREADITPHWLEALRSGLRTLSVRERLVVDQRYRLGWSRQRIAAALGMSRHGVKSLLRRIRRQLRVEVERRLDKT